MLNSKDSTVTYMVVSSPFGAAFQAPPSPDYVSGPEELEQAPLSPEFVPEPVYPEFMPPEDDVFPAEEQPLPAAVSLTAESPGYIADSDPEEDEEDPEEDPVNYPADGGDDDDDDDESFDDDEDHDDVEEDEEGLSILSVATYTYGLMAEIDRLLNPSPSTPTLSPGHDHYLRFLSPHFSIITSTVESVAMMRAAAPSTYILSPRLETPPTETPPLGTPPLLPIPLHTLSPPIILPSTVCRAGVSEGTPAETDVAGLSQRMTNFVTTVRQDTNEIYVRLDDAQDVRDCSLASSRPRPTGITCGDTKTDEYTADTGDRTAGTASNKLKSNGYIKNGQNDAKKDKTRAQDWKSARNQSRRQAPDTSDSILCHVGNPELPHWLLMHGRNQGLKMMDKEAVMNQGLRLVDEDAPQEPRSFTPSL
ncbi:hypothetical protein Tco_1304245 [Tanacetum coccineum]